MDRSQFSRLFTVEEANALLPELRPLLESVLESIRRLKGKSEVVIRNQRLDPDAPNLMDRLREDADIARLLHQIKLGIDEIHGHGCICKGVEQGLIDFPCMLGPEVVFLCWQLGEPTISYWHRIEDGFAGRRALLDAEDPGPGSDTSLH
ncbi:MAG: DUF2203 domain-containing protein [Deltaproteobacteria bacterium]|nr:DUF2203 domain-containing protein [Deltaproteobacteria bacterium]